MEGAMQRPNLWGKSVSRVELDQRSREERLRLERIERFFTPRAAATQLRLKRLLCLFGVGVYAGATRENRTRGPLSNQRPSRMPDIPVHQCLLAPRLIW